MYTLRKPYWVFVVNTGPVLVLLALGYGTFALVHTLLPPASVAWWHGFGLALGLLGLAAAGYAGGRLVRRQPLSVAYSVVQLLACSLLLCLFTEKNHEVLPFSVPRWMVPTNLVVMAWTFLMPTLAHALLALVARFTPDDRPHHAVPNLALALAVPIGWATFFQLLFWITSVIHWPEAWVDFTAVPTITALVVSTLSFFFFLVRAVYIITLRQQGFWADSALVWKLLITLVLPLVGLGLNNGLFFGQGFRGTTGIFGNFTSPWFYLLAIVNAALLCVPDSRRPGWRLLLLLGRSVLFGYTFYFFLVFLPFLPLSIPAIVLIGTGFLLLAPLLLFVVHVRQLSEDVAALRLVYAKATVAAVLVAGLASLPLAITANYWHSRRTLHEALAYVYTPDYATTSRLDAAALARTLAVVREHKDLNQEFLFGAQLPYLSGYFNWLVLDNLMLSDSKLADLERIFVGTTRYPADTMPAAPVAPRDMTAPVLRGLTATSTYDARQQAWVSWVNLTIVNPEFSPQVGEYRTRFDLPVGCWVSDYYLTIGNRQERGILAEKKAALWVFAQIVNENQSRDPGLLYYEGPNEVALCVYPVVGHDERRTRIQLLHKEPCTLTIDGQPVALGQAPAAPPVTAPVATTGQGVFYVSALAKQRLPLVRRRPYYHFLLDISARPDGHAPAYEACIARQLAQPLPNGGPPRFSLVNTYTTPLPAGADWAQELRRTPLTGGFFLTGALRRVLFEAHQHPEPTYPILVVVTDRLAEAVLDQDLADFSSAYPESDVFYVLGANDGPVPHSLRRASRQPLDSAAAPGVAPAVRAWPDAAHPRAYLPDTDAADIVLGQPRAVPLPDAAGANRWLTGLGLRGYGQWQGFHPETTDRQRVPFIQASFRAGILTPFTSFLALENEAQKAALRQKQGQVLAANASLDTLEDDEQDPVVTPIDSGVWLLVVAGALLLAGHRRRLAGLGRRVV